MRVESGANVFDLGATETAPTISLTDYSRRVTDDFGITTVVERGFSRTMSVRMMLPFVQVDTLQRRLAALRATSALWVADDRFACLSVTGFFKDFEIDLNLPPVSYCTLTVEGLTVTEPWADTGAEAAPGASTSTLRLLRPVAVTEAVLTASSVPETDYVEWNAADSYATGARARRAHRVWESLVDSNHGNDPTALGDTHWIDAGPTNRWAVFDEALGSATSATGNIIITLAPGVAVNGVAVLDTDAATVRVQAPGYDETKPVVGSAVNFLDLGTAANASVTITIAASGANVAVSAGTVLVGPLLGLGITEASPTAGITDYSRKDTDDFGEVTVVERAWAKRMSANALIDTAAVDDVFSRLASVRARPSLWVGQDGVEALTIYGFYKDFSIAIDENTSKLSLNIEGLSTATTVLPAIPVTVAWPDIADTDPVHPKPADGATNTRNPSTPVGTGGATIADVLSGSGVIDNDPPAIPTGLITDGGTVLEDGSVDLMFGWNANSEADLDGYVLGVALNNGSEVQFSAPSNRFTFHALPPNLPYVARVRAKDRFGNSSLFSAPVSGNIAKDGQAPDPPSGFALVAAIGALVAHWVAPTDVDVATIRLYESADANFAHATLVATLNAEPGKAGGTIRSVPTGQARYYWVSAVDTSDNESVRAGPVSETAAKVSGPDIYVDSVFANNVIATTSIVTTTFSARVMQSADSLPGSLVVTNTGFTLSTLATTASQAQALAAQDPAARIRTAGTYIGVGNILTQGGNPLSNWVFGGDNTSINGGALGANTVKANALTIGNRGISWTGLDFQVREGGNCLFWSAGYIQYYNDQGVYTQHQVNTGVNSNVAGGGYEWRPGPGWWYLTWSPAEPDILRGTTDPSVNGRDDVIILGSWVQGTLNLYMNYGYTIIDGSRITAFSVTATQIAALAIKTQHIDAGAVKAVHIDVDTLSAIKADVGLLRTASAGRRMEMEANQLRSYDENNTLRALFGGW